MGSTKENDCAGEEKVKFTSAKYSSQEQINGSQVKRNEGQSTKD